MLPSIDEGAFLAAVEERIRSTLRLNGSAGEGDPDLLLNAARHLCFSGGKRARPRLTLYFGQAAGAPEEALVDVAVASEFIHAASLLHDDVVDDGTQRRGRPTVNAQWGNTVAVLTGDLVLTLAFEQIKTHSKGIISEAIELVASMTRAALAEVQARGHLEAGLTAWESIALGKTGELFAWCGRAAAHLAADPDALERFGRCGRHLGMAFQLGDDLVDLLEETSGKDRYSDIRTRSLSYPLLTAVATSVPVRENLLRAWRKPQLEAEEVLELGEAVQKTGALERTWEEMEAEVAAAIEALGPYRHRAGGAAIAEWAARLCNGVLHGGGGKT
jgi:geranylgeranyl pyrophosphate synthase